MKRKSIIAALIVIVAVPLLCIVTLLLYVQFADLSHYKNSITAQLSQRLGREVLVAGQLDVKLFPMPALVVSQASLANAPWGSGAHMLTVQELQLRIALKPLFGAKILIDEFILSDAVVLMESNADGESNWAFTAGREKSAVKEKEKGGEINIEFTPDVRIVIERSLLRVIAGDDKPVHEYGFEQASLLGLGDAEHLSLQLAGRINQHDYTVSGSIGTLAALLSDRPYPVDLSIEALGLQSQLTGSITNPLALQRIDLKLAAKANNLNGFKPWLGENAVNAVGNVSAEFVVAGNLSEFNLRNINISARDAMMQGQAQVKIQDGRPLIKSELVVSNFDLNQFKGTEPESVSIQPAEKTVTDFKALAWSLDWLRGFDAVLSVQAKSLQIDQFAIESLQSDIALSQGLATVTKLQLASALGTATAKGEISVTEAKYQYALRLNASNWNIGSLIKPNDKTAAPVFVGADVEITASGNNVEQVLMALQASVQGRYRDDAVKQYIDLKLDRHRSSNSDNPQVLIAADIHSAGEKIRINGQVGEPLLLLTPEQPYPFSLKATSAKVNGQLKGSVTQLWDRRKINAGLKVVVKGKQELTLGTRLQGERKKYTFANINANFADGDITGEILADLTGIMPKLSGHLRLKGMRFTANAVNESAAIKEQSDSNSIEWLKKPFPKGLLSIVDTDISIAAQKIVMASEQVEQADARVRLHNNRLLLDPLHIESTLGVADVRLELAETADIYQASLHWKSQDTPLNALMANSEVAQSQLGLIDARANIRTQGGSLYQWLDNLRGNSAANYTDQSKQRKMIARLHYIESAENKPLPVRMALIGSKKETVFTIAGDLDTPMRLLRDDKPFRLNLTADALGITALLRGEIKQPLAGRGIDVAINASGESLGALEQVADLPIPKLGTLSMVGRIKGDFDKLNADLQADVADGFMRAILEYDHSGGAINIKTDVTAENLDLSWIDVVETEEIEDEKTESKKLFSEDELPFGILRQMNISAK
ncbi:AsmA family protein, partial [Kaarinaea lacus]